jgi:hypothetical protein
MPHKTKILLTLATMCLVQPAWSLSTIADAAALMPANSWQKINSNSFASVMTPDELRPTDYRPLSQIYSWTGSAWDGARQNLYLWGGDYNGHEGNEVYIFGASTGLWSRGSLPTQVTTVNNIITTVDGLNHSPTAGESYDNMVFLKNVNRLGVIGVSRDGETWMTTNNQVTGPYFWDPAKADANMVGGVTGSQANRNLSGDIPGGQMWQNRNNGAMINDGGYGRHTSGTTDTLSINGKDVVYVTDDQDILWRYTVNDLNPANDSWARIGNRNINGQAGAGSGAIDTAHNLYLKSLGNGSFGFWDLAKPGDWENNRQIQITPTLLTPGVAAPDTSRLGIEFDPGQNAYTMWDGSGYVWVLRAPTDLDPDGDGFNERATGWTLERLNVAGTGPNSDLAGSVGIYGKWTYAEEQGVFIGVVDPDTGDVFIYKPLAAVPEPTTWGLLLCGLVAVGAHARRKTRVQG